jgi:putative two-component system hydrogenase maturation factor HypX/HoxX
MRILVLAHAFNRLTQRLFVELCAAGHEVALELDIADAVTEEAVALFDPQLLIAPYLKRRIPEAVWSRRMCWVIHPGIPGDRGPAALDRAILRGEADWGVSVIQAVAEFDAGPLWASATFPMRAAPKSSLYRREVCDAALAAVRAALARWRPDTTAPPADAVAPDRRRGRAWAPLTREERRIDWRHATTAEALRAVHAADGAPGLPDDIDGMACRWFDAHDARHALAQVPAGPPGRFVARRGPALLRRTADGGVWLGHARREPTPDALEPLKRPAVEVFASLAGTLPDLPVALDRADAADWDELHYEEFADGRVGWLRFAFHNGALDTAQCIRLRDALRHARGRSTRVLVLAGGPDHFCHGIHLLAIEAAQAAGGSAADESWRNIQAIDDVVLELLTMSDRLTVSALQGDAGAGGAFLALAADEVWAHEAVLLNPHYKNMGNLFGSEYWSYVLPRRVGPERAQRITQGRLPLGVAQAQELGIVDACLARDAVGFEAAARALAAALAADNGWAARVAAKAAARAADEAERPLAAYRKDELARMHRNFYGFDPSYHVARDHFVHRRAHAWTPRHLAPHRAPR